MATFAAAKTLHSMASGKVSNLSLQKLLYLSHMMHLGLTGEKLASNNFEAWDYGPVEPQLYHKLKAYGAENVPDIFPGDPYANDSPEYRAMKFVMDQLDEASPRKLVAITHWERGAWAKNYRSGMRGIIIPDDDILQEYNERVRRAEQRRRATAS